VAAIPDFLLTTGDPWDAVQRRLHLKTDQPIEPVRRILLILGVVVLPLVVLAGFDGTLRSLVGDTLVVGRLLISLPVFVLAGQTVQQAGRATLIHLAASGTVPVDHQPDLETTVRQAVRLRDSRLVIFAMVAFALAAAFLAGRAEALHYTGAWASEGGSLKPAGWWYVSVSLPVFSVIRLRWLWRIVVWWRFLFGVSRIPLRTLPAHPDGSGGLGFLAHATARFAILVFAMCLGAGMHWRAAILAGDASLQAIKVPMAGLGVAMLVLLLVPLAFFLPQLAAAKRKGLHDFGLLGARYAGRFDDRWLRQGDRHDAELLGTGDIQSLTDLAGSFEVVNRMRIVPITLQTVIPIILAAALAMLPAVEAEIPLREIALKILGALR
jgi:hypothetical protein